MTWTWKNWLGYAGLALGAVLVSFIVEWHIRTEWQIFWLDGLIGWWADFVMFGWVRDYQTLLAGILAVAAGAFAFLAAMYQRRATLDDKQAESYRGAISTIYVVRGLFQRLILHGFKSDVVAMRGVITEIRVQLVALTQVSAGLADWLQFTLHEVEDGLDHNEEHRRMYPDLAPDYSIGIAAIAKSYLTDAERLFASGPYRHVARRMDQGDAGVLKVCRVNLDEISLAKGMVLPFEGK